MNIVLFTHPDFFYQQSMPRYANFLAQGMKEKGFSVQTWTAKPFFYKIPFPKKLKKWFAYIDQYLIFPIIAKRRIKNLPKGTLFVFADHALGPWVPLIKNYPHVIHCHDFLAQKSALKMIAENQTGWTGRVYQRYIRHGYLKARNFISVSEKTRRDLNIFLKQKPVISEVVYNGLNQLFIPFAPANARRLLGDEIHLNLSEGYLLHVGGNQWYKNREGVVDIYDRWRTQSPLRLPLLLIGETPAPSLVKKQQNSVFKEDIYFAAGLKDKFVRLAYNGATVFLFPSLTEGFGWPIAEAMASGCPVITTNEAPMTEVGASSAFYIPRKPSDRSKFNEWADEAAETIEQVIDLDPEERKKIIQAGLDNARRFDPVLALNKIELIYESVVQNSMTNL